jgi:hypothetical protein
MNGTFMLYTNTRPPALNVRMVLPKSLFVRLRSRNVESNPQRAP